MAVPFVATKLFVPKPRDGVVERSRLIERLDRGARSKLTLISAPAGFGKTTIVAAWLASRSTADRAVAWLSLDERDNSGAAFWSQVIAALQKAVASVRVTSLDVSRPEEQPLETVLASIVNELTTLERALDLVLDDYHVVNHSEVHAGMAFLLEHLPPNVHIVIATRSDPALPLARLRARGELVEIRAADLRFTTAETATYLNQSMGLGLAATDMTVLEDRTEGWIAALQLAALSMQGRSDPSSFVAGFAGDDRYVFDYLVEEVLERQPAETRTFLFETCFLDRLSGPLCDAVTGRSGSKATLDALYRANLFLVPLDDRREWYRYHHLFADVLLTQLNDEAERDLPVRRRRASDWYEQEGERLEAIRHALAAESFERAAELIELSIPTVQRGRGEALIRDWLHALPVNLVHNRPVLGIGFVGAIASLGEFDEVESRLLDIERSLAVLATGQSSDASRVVVVDETQLGRVPAAIELYRAAMAQVRGDVPDLIHHAQRAFDLAPPDDHLDRASASALLGIAHWSAGNLEVAYRSWSESRDGLERVGSIADVLGVSIALADIQLAQGHLQGAEKVFEQALQLAGAQDGGVLRGTADMHRGLSELHRERNDRQVAHQHLLKCHELGERAGLPQHPYRWRVAAALLRQDEGDLDGAVTLLDEAQRLYVADFHPNVRPVAAVRARVRIAQGQLDEALRWQRESGLGVDDELSYLREFEHIALARLLVAQHANGVVAFLDRLLDAAHRGRRSRSIIEISILRALVTRHDDIDTALAHLEHALSLASSEGYVRVFVDEGEPMAALLKLAIKRRSAPVYARTLLGAFAQVEHPSQAHPDLIEPLSERELDVLRLLRTDLGGPEIARQLMVSPNTMRTHTKNIYEKLGVNDRRAAVRRAEELDLLARKDR